MWPWRRWHAWAACNLSKPFCYSDASWSSNSWQNKICFYSSGIVIIYLTALKGNGWLYFMVLSWTLFHRPGSLMLQLHVPHVLRERDSHSRQSSRLHVARGAATSFQDDSIAWVSPPRSPGWNAGSPSLGERAQSEFSVCKFWFTQLS